MADRRIEIPPHMVQQLLQGSLPANQPPDVVEVLNKQGLRQCFNMDAVERVIELEEGCTIQLKGNYHVAITMTYDEFLHAARVQPRQLYAGREAGSRD